MPITPSADGTTLTVACDKFSLRFITTGTTNNGRYDQFNWLGDGVVAAQNIAIASPEPFVVHTPFSSNSYRSRVSPYFEYASNGDGTYTLTWHWASGGILVVICTPKTEWIEFEIQESTIVNAGDVLGVCLNSLNYDLLPTYSQVTQSLVQLTEDATLAWGLVGSSEHWRPNQNGHKRIDFYPGSLYSGETIVGRKFAVYLARPQHVKDLLGRIAASLNVDTRCRRNADGSRFGYLMVTDGAGSNYSAANARVLANLAGKMGSYVGVCIIDGGWRVYGNTRQAVHANIPTFISTLKSLGIRVIMHHIYGWKSTDSGSSSYNAAAYSGQGVDSGDDAGGGATYYRWANAISESITDATNLEPDYLDDLLARYEAAGFDGGIYLDQQESLYLPDDFTAYWTLQRYINTLSPLIPTPIIVGASGQFQNSFLQLTLRQARDIIVPSDQTATLDDIVQTFDLADKYFFDRPHVGWCQSHYLGTIRPWAQWQALIDRCKSYDCGFSIQGTFANFAEMDALYNLRQFAGTGRRARPATRIIRRTRRR